MMTWFIYDITDDRNRRELIKIAQKHGLYRVQKSVFLGNIEKDEVDADKIMMFASAVADKEE